MFDAVSVKNECVNWIRDFFDHNGSDCNAVVGISGGKDSSVVAALCTEALGRDRVIGVLMPNGIQPDIDSAKLLVKHLEIRYFIVNIEDAVIGLTENIPFSLSEQSRINLPARIRMAALYAVSQSNNGRVANTCNLSEDWVGYATLSGVWATVNVLLLASYAVDGSFAREGVLPTAALSLIPLSLAVVCGSLLAGQLNQKTFLKAAYILLIVSGAVLLVTNL